jgi:hypothetical protein
VLGNGRYLTLGRGGDVPLCDSGGALLAAALVQNKDNLVARTKLLANAVAESTPLAKSIPGTGVSGLMSSAAED